MFKNYLTYNLAISFNRSCFSLDLPPLEKNKIVHSTENVIHHLAKSIQTQDPKEESRYLAVALICLQDAKEALDALKIPCDGQYEVLRNRLEQLCVKAVDGEAGQFRLFG